MMEIDQIYIDLRFSKKNIDLRSNLRQVRIFVTLRHVIRIRLNCLNFWGLVLP